MRMRGGPEYLVVEIFHPPFGNEVPLQLSILRSAIGMPGVAECDTYLANFILHSRPSSHVYVDDAVGRVKARVTRRWNENRKGRTDEKDSRRLKNPKPAPVA